MADIAMVAAQAAICFPEKAEIFDFIAGEAITRGQAVYQASTGKIGVADANVAGKQQFRGIALRGGSAGQAISVLRYGHVAGFAVSGLNADAPVYLSDTAGALADAAGTMTVNAGRVVALTDAALTKVVFIEADWRRAWA